MGAHRYWCVLVALVIGCGPGNRNGGSDDDGSNGDDGCPSTCSADLHDLLDCHGNVLMQCDADLGCASGMCVDPCIAAADNHISVGCDYWAVDPDSWLSTNGSCYAAYVANTWTQPVSISVERDGQSLAIDSFARIPSGSGQGITYAPLTNGMLMPNQVAILFLAYTPGPLVIVPNTPCPAGITPAYTTADAAVHGTGFGKAFHITTSAPVVAYDIYPYGGGTSAVTGATLLLPTSAWDTNYVAVDAYKVSDLSSGGAPFVEIVGQQDSTSVSIRPTAAIVAGTGVAAAAAGSTATYTVNRGQVLQFTQNAELAGSPITSTAPIGVWGGSSCMNIPIDVRACDAAHQQIPPVRAMGNRYAAVRYRNRWPGMEESVPWHVVGGVDGTELTYAPATPAGAPTTVNLGQVVEFNAPGPFTVTSQDDMHPFYMSAHMTGCETYTSDQSDCRGDPEYVDIVPPDQYLSAYTFFTDPTYPETNLVLTRERKGGQFADVNIDCVGTVTGWMPIDADDTIEYTRVDLVTGNFQSVGSCNNGLHVAGSTQPFGLVVWGWGSGATGLFQSTYVSYAYPAGQAVKPINIVVIE
ncbi:MAG TPA: IgGFc-binding protein [Kofleriaceae bacterium]|nr:IgGFc-binding protein [Kofleriaceae bacterium]